MVLHVQEFDCLFRTQEPFEMMLYLPLGGFGSLYAPERSPVNRRCREDLTGRWIRGLSLSK